MIKRAESGLRSNWTLKTFLSSPISSEIALIMINSIISIRIKTFLTLLLKLVKLKTILGSSSCLYKRIKRLKGRVSCTRCSLLWLNRMKCLNCTCKILLKTLFVRIMGYRVIISISRGSDCRLILLKSILFRVCMYIRIKWNFEIFKNFWKIWKKK